MISSIRYVRHSMSLLYIRRVHLIRSHWDLSLTVFRTSFGHWTLCSCCPEFFFGVDLQHQMIASRTGSYCRWVQYHSRSIWLLGVEATITVLKALTGIFIPLSCSTSWTIFSKPEAASVNSPPFTSSDLELHVHYGSYESLLTHYITSQSDAHLAI